MTNTVTGRAVASDKVRNAFSRLTIGQRAGSDAVMLRGLNRDMQERPVVPGTNGLLECCENAAGQSGSQSNTSPERSSGMNAAFNAGAA